MNRNSKLRDRIRDATVEAILEAAEAVFADAGVHAAKVEAIAARAGVSVGTIYNHLGDREKVLSALVEARANDLLQALDDSLEEAEGKPFASQVISFMRACFTYFEKHSRFFSILMQGEYAKEQKLGVITPAMRELYLRAKHLIDRGLAEGKLKTELADLYPALLMGLVRSIFVRSFFDPKPTYSAVERVEQLARFFLEGAEVRRG